MKNSHTNVTSGGSRGTLSGSRLVSALMLVLLAGCDAPLQSEVRHYPYLFTVVPWIEDSGGWFLVDTGTPLTQLLPEAIGDAEGSFDVRAVPSSEFSAAGLNPGDQPFVITDNLPSRFRAAIERGEVVGAGGIIGGDLLSWDAVTFDPEQGGLTIGAHEFSATTRSVTVEVLGGGQDCYGIDRCVAAPATRLVGSLELGEHPASFIVDTAATYVMTTAPLLERLAAQAGLTQVRIRDDFGETLLVRVPTIRLGAIEAHDVIVAAPEGIDESIARTRIETGRPIEVVLGQSFLSKFVTTIDYPGRSLSFDPYASPNVSARINGATGVGVTLRDDGAGQCLLATNLVTRNGAPTSVPRSMELGECVTAVDGFRVADGATAREINAYLKALPLGSEVSFQVEVSSGPELIRAQMRDFFE